MNNPFLQDAYSKHKYKEMIFIIDKYGDIYQCGDANHYTRGRSKDVNEAIYEAHKQWDKYLNNKSNNKI
jgi:hypothetical protein